MAEFDAVELEPIDIVELAIGELDPMLTVEFDIVELEPVELEAANAGAAPAALNKIPSNNSPLALIFTKDESVFSYISN